MKKFGILSCVGATVGQSENKRLAAIMTSVLTISVDKLNLVLKK